MLWSTIIRCNIIHDCLPPVSLFHENRYLARWKAAKMGLLTGTIPLNPLKFVPALRLYRAELSPVGRMYLALRPSPKERFHVMLVSVHHRADVLLPGLERR